MINYINTYMYDIQNMNNYINMYDIINLNNYIYILYVWHNKYE